MARTTPPQHGPRHRPAGAARPERRARRHAPRRRPKPREDVRARCASGRASDGATGRAPAASYLPRRRAGQAACAPTAAAAAAHRATSEVLAGAYPFLAEAGLGSEGSSSARTPGPGAASATTRGCSTSAECSPTRTAARRRRRQGQVLLAKSLATRSIAFGRKVYVPGDPKGEWSVVAQAVGGAAIELGGG